MALSCTTVQWRGITLSSDQSSPFGVRNVAGWDERPDTRQTSSPRPGNHGRFSGAVMADERIVTVAGQIVSADRDALLQELDAEMYYSGPTDLLEPLTITRAGRTLTGYARLTAFRTPTDLDWSVGVVPFAIEWRCPDPLRYAAWVAATTTFPTRAGGLRFPLYSDIDGENRGALDYGPPSTTGRIALTNDGTADTWTQFNIAGPVPSEGFDIVTIGTNRRVRFSGAVPAASNLVIDTATGTAVIDGTADRGGLLTYREWAPVPRRGSVEYAFIPLGSTSAAVLTASLRPAFG